MITIYADGACSGNPGPAGSAILVLDHNMETVGSSLRSIGHATNQVAELTAALMAIEAAISINETEFTIRCDSEYVVKGINEWMQGWIAKNWRTASRTPVANVDLWKQINIALKEAQAASRTITFQWVKGHASDQHNNTVDRMAVTASKQPAGRSSGVPYAPIVHRTLQKLCMHNPRFAH